MLFAKGQSGLPPLLQRLRRWVVRGGVVLLALFALDRGFPPPIPAPGHDGATLVLARDGTPLRAFANREGTWRYPTAPERVSPYYLEALLGYEDRWFAHHPGVNPGALARAAWQALRNGRVVSGGSTLTMQVARLIEPMPRSGSGKIKQLARALQLELRLSKREILTLYLDRAPFGGNIEGVEAASWAYLGKSAAKLSRAEAALLAVLPQAPSRLRPDRHAAAARAARDKVLARLRDLGTWDGAAFIEAQLEPVVARRLRAPMRAALLAERLREAHARAPVITSTIDAPLQAASEARLARWVEPLPERTSAAVLIVENRTRDVVAYAGSARFGDAKRLGHVDMVRATRSPGSTLKPFLYAIALDDGLIHSESLLVDAPQDFDGYRPGNF
ncbi:MAG TPA: transglycosylase domain-containing protein, partial [Xanthomonadales bacterium]|nr:transglycosylase domain-containing protein [Xanthomonadales bacterium]